MPPPKSVPCAGQALLAGAVAWLLSVPTVVAQSHFPPDSAVRALLRGAVDSGRAVGIVVGLLDADGTRRVLSAGSSGVEGLPLDAHTVFEIGSVTKVFTATLLADMARRGEVRLDEPVEKLLPPKVKVPSRNGRRITLLHLATHYSGLPREPLNRVSPDPAVLYPLDSLYAFLNRYELPRDPGAAYEYSNLGVALLGHALGRRAGTEYGRLVKRRILAPLGMRETKITLTPAERARLAQGHSDLGDPVPNWDLSGLPGSGALRSTAADLLTFAAANLVAGSDPLADAMRDTHVARRAIPNPSSPTAQDSIGLVWRTSRRAGSVITWKNGGTAGYRTSLALDLAARRAVVILTNSAIGCDDIAFHLLDPASPIDPVPVVPEVVRAYRQGGAAAAVARYRELRREPELRRQFDVHQLNDVGYWLLDQGRAADAVAIFRLNVEHYPDESNTYDSLGEALLALGDTAAATRNYERSVELDPGNSNGVAILRRLKAAR